MEGSDRGSSEGAAIVLEMQLNYEYVEDTLYFTIWSWIKDDRQFASDCAKKILSRGNCLTLRQ